MRQLMDNETPQGVSDEWSTIPWRKLERYIFRLQKRIYKAKQRGDTRAVRGLKRVLKRSKAAKTLAVRQVTQDNRGKRTAGIDGVKNLTPAERQAMASHLTLEGKATPVRRIWIPKPGKDEKRPLGIPTMMDRARQALAKMALEPEWEAVFEPHSYGFRPGRSCHDAIEQIFTAMRKEKYILEADIKGCFDNIAHEALLDKVNDPELRPLLKGWLKAGIMDQEVFQATQQGTPQGGVTTPPTKWQTFFFGAGLPRIWINSKDDIHAVRGHFHPLDQGTNHLAFAQPVRVLQPRINLGRKVL